MRLLFIGEIGRATGWLGRAQRLLDGVADDCVERGYLLLPEAHMLMARNDPGAAARVAHEAAVIGERFADFDLSSLARMVEGRAHIVAGERKRPQLPGRVYQQMEIEYGSFHRQVRLVEDVDPEHAHASFEHGVLTVELPVVETPPPAGRYRITVERVG